jgi:hypothetical protein
VVGLESAILTPDWGPDADSTSARVARVMIAPRKRVSHANLRAAGSSVYGGYVVRTFLYRCPPASLSTAPRELPAASDLQRCSGPLDPVELVHLRPGSAARRRQGGRSKGVDPFPGKEESNPFSRQGILKGPALGSA